MHPKKPLGCPAAALDLSICKWGIEFPEVKGGWCLLEVHLHLLARSTPSLITILLYHPYSIQDLGRMNLPGIAGPRTHKIRMVWMQEGGSGPCIAIGSFPQPGAKCLWKRWSHNVALIFLLRALLLPSQVPGGLALEFFHARRIFRMIFSHVFEYLHIGWFGCRYFFVPMVLLGLTASFYTPVLSEM